MAELVCALGPDCNGTLLRDLIDSAERRVRLGVWELGPGYAEPLIGAAERGVSMRIVLDSGSQPGNAQGRLALSREPKTCLRLAEKLPGWYAHWKVMVVDDALVVTTGNLISVDAPWDWEHRLPAPRDQARPGNREWMCIVSGAPTLVEAARRQIDAVWSSATPPLGIVTGRGEEIGGDYGVPPQLVAPLTTEVGSRSVHLFFGGAAVADTIKELIENARQRILITVPYVHTAAPHVDRLMRQLTDESRPKDVRLLLGATPANADAKALDRVGLSWRVMDPSQNTSGHAKGIVADDRLLVTSSNFSEPGLTTNLESGLTVHANAAATYFADAFERDWELSIQG